MGDRPSAVASRLQPMGEANGRTYYALCLYIKKQKRIKIKVITLGDRLMVGQRILDPFIGVRVPVPQLIFFLVFQEAKITSKIAHF